MSASNGKAVASAAADAGGAAAGGAAPEVVHTASTGAAGTTAEQLRALKSPRSVDGAAAALADAPGSTGSWLLAATLGAGLAALYASEGRGSSSNTAALALVAGTAAVALYRHRHVMLPELSDTALLMAEGLLFDKYVKKTYAHVDKTVHTAAGEWNVHAVQVPASMTPEQAEHTLDGVTILLHGHSTGMGVWCKVLDGLAGDGLLYGVDLPGWGRSLAPDLLGTHHDPDELLDMMVDMLEAWRAATGIRHMTIVAHSFGAFLAIHYAARFPEAVDHVVLVSPAGIVPVTIGSTWRIGFAFKHLPPQKCAEILGRFGLVLMRHIWPRFASESDPLFAEYYWQLAAAATRRAGRTDLAFGRFVEWDWSSSCWKRPALGELLALRQHITIVTGLRDNLVPSALGTLVTQLRPGGVVHIMLKNAKHNPAHSRPQGFVDAIAAGKRIYRDRLLNESITRISAHASIKSIDVSCTACGKPVLMDREHFKCGCATWTWLAPRALAPSLAQANYMLQLYRELFVDRTFTSSELDSRYVIVNAQVQPDDPRRVPTPLRIHEHHKSTEFEM